jgi:hypothetical protein
MKASDGGYVTTIRPPGVYLPGRPVLIFHLNRLQQGAYASLFLISWIFSTS